MLELSLVNIICIVINLLILFILMKLFLFKPVNKIIEKRQHEADQQIDEANTAKQEAFRMQEEYENTLKGIEEERNQKMAETYKEATAEYDRILSEAHTEAENMINDARAEAEVEKAKILRHAESDITDMVIAATAKVVAAKSDEETDRALYEQFLTKAGDSLDEGNV